MRQFILSLLLALSFFVFSCSSSENRSEFQALTSGTWQLILLNGKTIEKNGDNGIPDVRFTSDFGFSGYTGCNTFNGIYKIENDKLILKPGAITKMFCAGSPEVEFLNAILKVNGYKISSGFLYLLNDDKELMRFKPQK